MLEQEEPQGGSGGEHVTPGKNRPASIRVTRKQSDIDQVAVLIFELFNIRFFKEQNNIWRQVCRGKIGKEDYVEKSFRLEHQAMIMTRKFLDGHCFTFRNASLDDSSYQEIISCPSSYKKFAMQGRLQSHMEYFEKVYNEKILPHLQSGRALPRERYTMSTEKIRRERNFKFLWTLDWAMSLVILSSIGFIVGSCYPEASLLYPFVLTMIGAAGKIGVRYYVKKQKKPSDKPPRRYK
jgi:hypothetical protein